MSENSGKQVVARAAAVLNALEGQSDGLSLGRIASAADLPRSTVHRLVMALEAQQLVLSTPKGIVLGPALARLAASAHVCVADVARPFMEALGRRTRETVDLSIHRGLHAISVAQYASDQELRVCSPVGTAFPLHCTAHGKALLASMQELERRSLLQEILLEQRTATTLTNKEELEQEVKQIRSRGLALDREEHANGVCGLGVVLHTGPGARYALSLAVPALRFSQQQSMLEAALRQCQAEIEARFSNHPED